MSSSSSSRSRPQSRPPARYARGGGSCGGASTRRGSSSRSGVTHAETATLIYTSGSTGQPKGVILTHGAFATECDSIGRHGLKLSEDDVYLSYLPLAHVFERLMGGAMCSWYGVPTAFCKVEEMSDALKLVRPTILVGVPAVWRKIKDKVQSQLDSATGLKAKLVRWAFAQKKPGLKRFIAENPQLWNEDIAEED